MRFLVLIILNFILVSSCNCDCENEDCRVNIAGKPITVVSNVTGKSGTYISPDSVYNIQQTSALVDLKIVSISPCHEILGFGHTWSEFNSTPTLDFSSYVDYGEINKDNFTSNYIITSLLRDLSPNTNYYVRSWLAVDVSYQDCSVERIIFYSDDVKKFKTL